MVQRLRLLAFTAETRVQSLSKKLRSCKLHSVARKPQNKKQGLCFLFVFLYLVVLGLSCGTQDLGSPFYCKEIQPVHPKGDQSWCSLDGLMLKLKLQYFGHLMWRADSFEKTLMLGTIEGRRRRE